MAIKEIREALDIFNHMSVRTISVAILQLAAHNRRDFTRAWSTILDKVQQAADADVRLIVLPEVTIPGYVFGLEPVDAALTASALADLQRISNASHCVIVAGVAQPGMHGGVHGVENCAAVVCPLTAPRFTSKRFLWHFDHRWFDAGTDLNPIDTPLGKLGIIICADGRIPSIARTLVDRGAQVLVIVTAWVTTGADPLMLENIQADLLVRVRAWENSTPIVAANKVGAEIASVLYCGKSQSIAADGTVVALASQDQAQTLFTEVVVNDELRPYRTTPLALERCMPARTTRVAVSVRLTSEELDAAVWCDVEAIVCTQTVAASSLPTAVIGTVHEAAIFALASLHVVVLPTDALRDPGYLIAARRAGYDLFVWYPQHIDEQWILPLAKTRAIELRIYLIVVEQTGRISVISPAGIILAGTTSALRLAQFVYDPMLASATTIVPHTDILVGLAAAARAIGDYK